MRAHNQEREEETKNLYTQTALVMCDHCLMASWPISSKVPRIWSVYHEGCWR